MENETNIPCIDIGVNLTSRQFRGDHDQVIESARNAGLTGMILTGSSESNSAGSAEICSRHEGFLFSTAGIHPHDAKEFHPQRTVEALKRLYELPQVVAVGECGLDFNRDFSPRDAQRSCFRAHLEIAAGNGLPMFLHERDAHQEFLEMMTVDRDRISRAVVHCFTGTLQQAKAYLDLDLHLGITGWICDERRGSHLREVVKSIPAERLMIETDAPYLAPRDYRPRIKRNEPKYLPHILQAVARCRNESPEELAPKLIRSTSEFFGISEPVR